MGLWAAPARAVERTAHIDLPALPPQTEALPACRFLINPNDESLINPDDMRVEIRGACRETGPACSRQRCQLARCIFDSLALLYADILHELANLRGENLPNCILPRRMPKRATSTSCAPMHGLFA